MNNIFLFLTINFFCVLDFTAQVKWNVDPAHSKLGFSVVHMMVSETEGKFKIYRGNIITKSETDFTDAVIEFTASVNSISTDDEKRDKHLRGPDFFDAEKFPEVIFRSTKMQVGKIKGTYELEGNLTMKGVTRKEKLIAVGADKPVINSEGKTLYAFKVTGKINRRPYGLKWNALIEAGGVVVSQGVKINCTVELIKE